MATSKKPIFIHSLFRTGSTYIWNKFRQNADYYCYYEPLHPVLLKATEENIENLMTRDFDSVNHPTLDRHYLYEYIPLLRKDIPGVLYFKKSFSFDEFCYNETNRALKKYIDYLLLKAGDKIPLIQFNRTAFRIKWFKENYPDSLNIYLIRQPRDQWNSYFEIQKKTTHPIFFVMDLLTASINKNTYYFKPLSQFLPLVEYHESNFEKEEKFYRLILDTYPDDERYFITYYTWLLALFENVKHSDIILNMNLLSSESIYRKEIIGFFKKKGINGINFEDARIRQYPNYPISQTVMKEIEIKCKQLLLQSFPENQINCFFEKISSFDTKYFQFNKKNFPGKMSKKIIPIDQSRLVDELGKKHILLSVKFFSMEEENNNMRNSIINKDIELRQYEQESKRRLQEKDKQLAQKDELVRQYEQESKQRLQEKDDRLAQKDELLARKDKELKILQEKKEQQLTLKDLQINMKDEQIKQNSLEYEKLKQELKRREYLLLEKNQKIAEKEFQISEKSKQSQQKEEYIQEILSSYAYRTGRILLDPLIKLVRLIKKKGFSNSIDERVKKTQ